MELNLPKDCPFIVRELQVPHSLSSYYLIREHDAYAEYPNIYAKICRHPDSSASTVVFLSDTGTGKDVKSRQQTDGEQEVECQTSFNKSLRGSQSTPARWNLASVLSHTINPHHNFPYVIITTHCHYDHIMGIRSLLRSNARITVMSSSHRKSYLVPWSALQRHSLCDSRGLKAPHYPIKWLDHGERISYNGQATSSAGSGAGIGITVFHTPGHTPDSLTWYDHDANLLSVGDTFYERESDDTRRGSGKWAAEPPQPVILNHDSNLKDWMKNMDFLIDFVREENKRRASGEINQKSIISRAQDGIGTSLFCKVDEVAVSSESEENWLLLSTDSCQSSSRVKLCAAHVTVSTDALTSLLEMKHFMIRVLKDEVPSKQVEDDEKREEVWLWDDCLGEEITAEGSWQTILGCCRFSLKAPIRIVEKAKGQISISGGIIPTK